MLEHFDHLNEISRSEFLKRFDQHIINRYKGEDSNERMNYKLIYQSDNLKFFECCLKQSAIENIILPHHAVELEEGKDPDRAVKTGGEKFTTVINDFSTNYMRNNRFPNTVKKILKLKKVFFNKIDIPLNANFLYFSNDKEIAHIGHYNTSHGNKIFMGNGFHRLVAYGLFLLENDFVPLNVHLVITNY